MSIGRRLPCKTGGLAVRARLGRGSVLVPGRHEGVCEQGDPPPEEKPGQFLRSGGERMPAFSYVQAAAEEVGLYLGVPVVLRDLRVRAYLRDGD